MNDETKAPDWEAIRARYEAGQEPVDAIATAMGLTRQALSSEARKRGWLLRKKSAARPKAESTRETLRRLKDVVQKRLRQLEGEMGAIGEELNALTNERDIRSTNMLVRTLEKVLQLEDKERKQRGRRAHDVARLNDAGREELARRIESLRAEQPGSEPDTADQGGAELVVGLAAVGEDRSASA